MQRTVRMHRVVAAEHARQRALDDGVVEELDQFGDERQQVVAEMTDAGRHLVEALEDQPVVGLRQRGFENQEAVGDECLQLLVGERDVGAVGVVAPRFDGVCTHGP